MPQPADSALQACRAILHRAIQEVEALTPRRNDTSVSDEAGADLRRVVASLLDPLDDMQRALAPLGTPSAQDGKDLDTLRWIIRTHGLSQFDAPLSLLAERVADPSLMIAILGRTNAGKSSLINRMLGTDLLPVDAVPATSVPVRVTYGPRAHGEANFARAAPDFLTADRVRQKGETAICGPRSPRAADSMRHKARNQHATIRATEMAFLLEPLANLWLTMPT